MSSSGSKKWKYYNHAVLPKTAPHEIAELAPIHDGSIFRAEKKALLARWTSDFDCGTETAWWWVIKDAPYIYEELSPSAKKHIRQALGKCTVRKIDPLPEKDALWRVYRSAYMRYQCADNFLPKEAFFASLDEMKDLDFWAVYLAESSDMIGWMTCREHEDYAEMVTAKYDVEHLNKRPSDAVHHTVCAYYLGTLGKKYLCAGERNINHITHSQEYKINTFGFRKAYCKLHIRYRGWIKMAVWFLYPFRRIFERFSGNPMAHKIKTILKMEEIARSFRA